MKKFYGLAMGLTLSCLAMGQDSLSDKRMEDVIIYSNKFAENRKNIVQNVEVISAQRITQLNAQNTGDLLINTGNVFVQKSQQGGSSPVIRGFEASRVLLVVDGIRMNNAIYRAGHLQNVISIDQNMLERVEILYGPASTIYGSDALGGVVHFRTKQPRLSLDGNPLYTGSAFVRYSSANNEKTAHLDQSIGGRRFGWLQSYNFSDFGDMKMGSNYHEDYPDFGRRSQYVADYNGIDSIFTNADDRVQKFSGYKQWDVSQKFLFKQNDRVSHLLNLQLSNTNNIPRYDRLQDVRNGGPRYAEWYYGPQFRAMAAYELNIRDLGFVDEFRTILSYQRIKESRHQRDYRRYDRLDNRIEKLHVIGVTIDGRRLWGAHELTVGVDAQLNDLTSSAYRRNINTRASSPLDTRYPNGENRMNYFGAYAQHLLKMMDGKLVLNDGIRIQTNRLNSTIADNSFFNFPFTAIEQNNTAVTGNLGLAYMPVNDLRFTAGVATGFRAPNIDDLARIFESNTAAQQLVVPNPGIRPEYTYNADAGITGRVGNIIQLEANGFMTWFRNAIALSPFQLNGQDSVNYNGTRSLVFANQNVNRAVLYGFNVSGSIDFMPGLRLMSTYTYTRGRLQPQGKAEVPLDHIPPTFGKTAISFSKNRWQLEAYALYNGWKKLEDYNTTGGEDNLQYATPEGMPSWYTLNFKSTLPLHRYVTLQFGVENLLDRNYRYFASGFSAPGRNFIAALRGNF